MDFIFLGLFFFCFEKTAAGYRTEFISYPLTSEDFERADKINDSALVRQKNRVRGGGPFLGPPLVQQGNPTKSPVRRKMHRRRSIWLKIWKQVIFFFLQIYFCRSGTTVLVLAVVS